MFSRVDTNRSARSRKRQKTSHDDSDTTASSSRSTTKKDTNRASVLSKTASLDETADREQELKAMDSKKASTIDKEKELALEGDLESMRQLITCKICQRFLTEPYGLACGHTYCYICLDTWLVAQSKNTCPECRATVKSEPVPSLIIRELVQMFSTKARLLPEGEDMEELKANATEAAEKVAKDKSNTSRGGLFKGMFSRAYGGIRAAMFDAGDNVSRCPLCFHELEDGRCSGCGERIGDDAWSDEDDHDFDEDDDLDEHDPFGGDDHYDIHIAEMNNMLHAVRRRTEQQAGRQPTSASRLRNFRRPALSISSNESRSGDSDDEEQDLEGFVVPDDDEDEQAQQSSSSTISSGSASTLRNRNRASRAPNANRPIVLSDSEEDMSEAELDLLDEVTVALGHRARQQDLLLRQLGVIVSPRPAADSSDNDDDDEDGAPIAPRRAPYLHDANRLVVLDDESDEETVDTERGAIVLDDEASNSDDEEHEFGFQEFDEDENGDRHIRAARYGYNDTFEVEDDPSDEDDGRNF